MAIAVASISTYVYKYVIHRIAISYAARGAISAQIAEKRYHLLCRSPLYLYLYCIYIVLLYLWSRWANKMHVQFTILFHLKPMIATTFNTFQVCEYLLGWGSLPTLKHLPYNTKLTEIVPRIHPVCMLRLSINSYLDDTAHELSWLKLSDFSIKTFLKLKKLYQITSQANAQSYLHRNRQENGQFFSKNIVQTSKIFHSSLWKSQLCSCMHHQNLCGIILKTRNKDAPDLRLSMSYRGWVWHATCIHKQKIHEIKLHGGQGIWLAGGRVQAMDNLAHIAPSLTYLVYQNYGWFSI